MPDPAANRPTALDPARRRGPAWVIAVDGPAASGKGTIARRIAAAYGFAYLDTGGLYRVVGLAVTRAGTDPDDAAAATNAARRVADHLAAGLGDDPALRNDETAVAASRVAVHRDVRAALLDSQRAFAESPPDGRPGAVLDGRDIGTVVCPEADLKLFVTASVEIRAERRLKELLGRGGEATYDGVLEDLKNRDARDRQRQVAPLSAAADAFLLDTSTLDAEAAFAAALDVIAKTLGQDTSSTRT